MLFMTLCTVHGINFRANPVCLLQSATKPLIIRCNVITIQQTALHKSKIFAASIKQLINVTDTHVRIFCYKK